MERLDPAELIRFAATCSPIRAIFAASTKEAPLFRRLAGRMWGESACAEACTYGGDWRALCFDDNARSGVSSTVLNVPASALRWPEDAGEQYFAYRGRSDLFGFRFQVSAGFLFEQTDRFGETLDIAVELLLPGSDAAAKTNEARLPTISLHMMIALERRKDSSEALEAEDAEDAGLLSHTVTTFCTFDADNTLLLVKNFASCAALLGPESARYLHSAGGGDSGERESDSEHVRLRVDVLRVWDKPTALPPSGASSTRRPSTAANRRVPVISCNCEPTADLRCPAYALRAVLRRCWSTSPMVKETAWRYLGHLLGVAKVYQPEKFSKLAAVLTLHGGDALLLSACGADGDAATASVAVRIISHLADVQSSAERLRQRGAIGVLTHLNAASNNRTLRLAAGQAVASLVPLDAEGIDMIRSLRLG
eukprot:jgi/Tetstr1/459545/TSEL_004910.t1